jgi:hypothetical protein
MYLYSGKKLSVAVYACRSEASMSCMMHTLHFTFSSFLFLKQSESDVVLKQIDPRARIMKCAADMFCSAVAWLSVNEQNCFNCFMKWVPETTCDSSCEDHSVFFYHSNCCLSTVANSLVS